MRDVRVILIGGTSNVGKSTVARALAAELGFEYRSTDGMARHPGRPWHTPEWRVPPHVAEHYRTLTPEELTDAVFEHYERLWPRVAELAETNAADGPGLVLEGSGVLPGRVAELTDPRVAAVWITADEDLIRARVHDASGHAAATEDERLQVAKFLARTTLYQSRMLKTVDALGLDRLHAGDRTPAQLTEAVLAAVAEQESPGRSRASRA
ncbi:hypothetical protein AB0I28_00805 [Phytomonospora sp. NPDC050363]|uniref:hypothetical protein n=1 Tax=Phytomonospora sp. NPDC050363 TaxID=3155642 RepID=UPI0033C1CFDD